MDIHKDFPKTVGRNDFWRQIKRTVNGEPVSDSDIEAIVLAIRLSLFNIRNENVHLLDLGCGNSALSSYLLDDLIRYTGVDFSEYLIGVAKEFFFNDKVEEYIVSDILSFLETKQTFQTYTHILCYGVMSYLPKASIAQFLQDLFLKFPRVNDIYLGNLPEKTMASKFYANRNITQYDPDDHLSPIGVWWDPQCLAELAISAGWIPKLSKMPQGFYASEYRFDLALVRA